MEVCMWTDKIFYPKPMHVQTAFANNPYEEGSCPVTEELCDKVLFIPIHPYITEEDVDRVCEVWLKGFEVEEIS